MGPHFFKCGKILSRRSSTASDACFNGAALFQVRKEETEYRSAVRKRQASMGPHFFKCGKSLRQRAERHWKCKLQWGRTFSSAESYAGRWKTVVKWTTLQWGRTFSSAERRYSSRIERITQPLQWGRTFSSAERPWRGFSSSCNVKLQWGRTFSSAEREEPRAIRERRTKLQWGRTFSSAESFWIVVNYAAGNPASMGPHFFKCGKTSNVMKSRHQRRASMGPHFFKCGKHLLPNRYHILKLASMGPHFFKCGKICPVG